MNGRANWQESTTCRKCTVKFGVFTREHHCRACGECFCDDCSSQTIAIPSLGFKKAVRVCDRCAKVHSGGDHSWASDSSSKKCRLCKVEFTFTLRKHHCRACGDIFCDDCTPQKLFLPHLGITTQERVCKRCHTKYRKVPGCDPSWGLTANDEEPKCWCC
eukprot:TRINITY_DN13359_c0_g1_i2.p1 TRINITY_DN13359_c0_g1~~TRINITY_DN13359_c0_g1_i2.p1  ORF type:complete len:160 (-),score=11.49 TRINITY_DN13359_c0_g1_i2:272-751(-)